MLVQRGDLEALKSSSVARELESRDLFGRTPLSLAAIFGQLPIVSYLLGLGANPNAGDTRGFTPLHYAVGHEWPEVMNELCEHGADVNAATRRGLTPLHIASSSGAIETVKFLMHNGSKLDVSTTAGATPMYMAKFYDRKAVIEVLRTALGRKAHSASPEI